MANMSAEVGDPDSQEVIMHQQLIAELEPQTMQIDTFERQVAKDVKKRKLENKQSSESERSSAEVNVQKVSKKRPLKHQKSHKPSHITEMELPLPEQGEGPSPIYYEKQRRKDRIRETKGSQDHSEPYERYRDLPPAERGQPDDRPPKRPHWKRRQWGKNVSGRPGMDRNFNKQDRQRQDGPEDVSVCPSVSSPEKMEEHRKELREIGEEIKNHLVLLDKDDSLLKPSEKFLKHNFNQEHARLLQREAILLKLVGGAKIEPQHSSPLKHEYLKTDSIEIETCHLQRTELMGKVKTILRHHQFVLLTSPAASGKTSLLKMIGHSMGVPSIYLSCGSSYFSGLNVVMGDVVDDFGREVSLRNIDYQCIVMLDDAQAQYDDLKFWNDLIKIGQHTFRSNIHFIIAATHTLSGGRNPSPPLFQSLQRLSRADFLLSELEAWEFLNSPAIGLKPVMRKPNLIKLIIAECGGLIGALRLSVNALTTRFAQDFSPPEADLLAYYLSIGCIHMMGRCFGVQHSSPIQDNFKVFLTRCFLGDLMQSPELLDEKDQECFDYLQKCGVLVKKDIIGPFEFSSQLARRYYSEWLFPHRSDRLPESLVALVKKVIENMSASMLQQSTVDGNDFPKEATFQHLWMQGLAQFTPVTCCICPELSKVFPFAETSLISKIEGEIDFYLNGDLRWGIELLVNGNRITEHFDRFAEFGKYFPLSLNDYAVVDFRQNKSGQATNVISHPKRNTVFFKTGDFSMCRCLFGLDKEPVTFTLRP